MVLESRAQVGKVFVILPKTETEEMSHSENSKGRNVDFVGFNL